jgi:signal transduction histidine kinase
MELGGRMDQGEQHKSPAFSALSDAVLAIAGERSVEPILQKLVDAARELADARYAALGVPDDEGAFAQFITSGMTDELIEAMGPLPRTHGLLGAMLESEQAYRTSDVRRDPRFRGWWPAAHPDMRSFLGVPIVSRTGIIGAFYLTDKVGSGDFTEADERLIETFAAHASVAIENARLYERSRELSIVEERTRVARELHDSVTQQLFSIVLTAEAADTLLDRDRAAARAQLERLRALAKDAMDELSAVISALRPVALEADGLEATLRKHVDLLRRVYRRDIGLEIGDAPRLDPAAEGEVFRIVQEALQNALRHADAGRLAVRIGAENSHLLLTVTDDGIGFDTADAPRSRRLGLTSMEERARALGGKLAVESRPGAGTIVRLEVPS